MEELECHSFREFDGNKVLILNSSPKMGEVAQSAGGV